MDEADRFNEQMVDRLVAEGTLWAPAVIAAFRQTPRHRFIDRVFQYQRKHNGWREILTRDRDPEQLALIYADRALITALGREGRHGPDVPVSSSSQPSLMGQMLQDLQVRPGHRVLEVGAGTGYNASLLAHLAGPERVTTVDVDRDVLSQAWDHLRAFPERQVRLCHADGRCGYADGAPYDRIMVTAATPDLEPAWLEQLAPHGRLLAPLTLAPGLEYIVSGEVLDGVFRGRLTRAAYFMPLRAEDEAGATCPTEVFGTDSRLKVRAPWDGWFDRKKPRINWLRFTHSIGFHGWLQGLSVHFHLDPEGQSVVQVRDRSAWCWFGRREWRYSEGGRELGASLWRSFLDLGGPWPTDYRLTASPAGGLTGGGRRSTLRQGPHCQQLWELGEERDRPAWS